MSKSSTLALVLIGAAVALAWTANAKAGNTAAQPATVGANGQSGYFNAAGDFIVTGTFDSYGTWHASVVSTAATQTAGSSAAAVITAPPNMDPYTSGMNGL